MAHGEFIGTFGILAPQVQNNLLVADSRTRSAKLPAVLEDQSNQALIAEIWRRRRQTNNPSKHLVSRRRLRAQGLPRNIASC
jgi:hypothetical protein